MNTSSVLNLKNILFGIGIFAIVVALLGFSGKLPGFTDKAAQGTGYTGSVTIWGTIAKENLSDTLEIFNKNVAKTYTVLYKEVEEKDLQGALTNALADGTSPDILLTPYSYTLANEKRLTQISNQVISETDYKNTFADEGSILLGQGGYLGLPIAIDPLVLYFNRDILSSSGIATPPATWDQFFEYESKITQRYQDGNFKISTIALGNYDNIPHVTDIVMAMIMQLGEVSPVSKTYGTDVTGSLVPQYKVNLNTDINDPAAESGSLNIVLAFMKNFSDSQKETFNWHANMPSALDNFIAGSQAFYIGYASESGFIKASNQKLYFDYTYIPQVAGKNISTTYGRMYTFSLLKSSPNPQAAYSTMLALATGEYSSSVSGATGAMPALKSLLAAPAGDQASIIFGHSALIAKGFQDLHRDDLEFLMKKTIEDVYRGSRSTVEAAKDFTESMQNVYDGR